jgi:hypothetical protein
MFKIGEQIFTMESELVNRTSIIVLRIILGIALGAKVECITFQEVTQHGVN